jgi:hypothetical protein
MRVVEPVVEFRQYTLRARRLIEPSTGQRTPNLLAGANRPRSLALEQRSQPK